MLRLERGEFTDKRAFSYDSRFKVDVVARTHGAGFHGLLGWLLETCHDDGRY